MPKTPRKCPGFESFQRLNYLNQIRNFMAAEVGNTVLASYYGSLFDSIAKKSVIRIDSAVKRQICKKCKCPLISGVTATVKIKSNKKAKSIAMWKCKQCKHIKKYPIDSNKKLWNEKPESVIELLDYSNK